MAPRIVWIFIRVGCKMVYISLLKALLKASDLQVIGVNGADALAAVMADSRCLGHADAHKIKCSSRSSSA